MCDRTSRREYNKMVTYPHIGCDTTSNYVNMYIIMTHPPIGCGTIRYVTISNNHISSYRLWYNKISNYI